MKGWICPKCGKVYAPDVKECSNCNWLANITASGRINQSPSTETRPQDVTATMNTQEKRKGLGLRYGAGEPVQRVEH